MSAKNGIKLLDSLADDPQKQIFCSKRYFQEVTTYVMGIR